jgi:uncharacterized membrane protein (UPF0127 family)
MKHLLYSVFFSILCVFTIACTTPPEVPYVQIGNDYVSVEVVDSDEERQKGLMHREQLDENNGMLFIFETTRKLTFWMKNTLIPLDMIFISKDMKVINILTAEPCTQDPCTLYSSETAGKYVLEVNAGWSKTHNIKAGDEVMLQLQ